MSLVEDANQVAVSAGGRRPQWDKVADATATPESVADMVFLEKTIIAQFAVVMRRHFTRRHAAVITPVFAASTTYRVSVDTNNVDTATAASGDDLASLLADMVSDINGDGTVGALVTAELWDADGDGVDDSVILVDVDEGANSFTTLVTVTAGTGTITAVEDATTATMTLLLFRGGTSKAAGVEERPTAPLPPNGYEAITLDWNGFLERLPVGGQDYGSIHLTSITNPSSALGAGKATPEILTHIGPNIEGL